MSDFIKENTMKELRNEEMFTILKLTILKTEIIHKNTIIELLMTALFELKKIQIMIRICTPSKVILPTRTATYFNAEWT